MKWVKVICGLGYKINLDCIYIYIYVYILEFEV